MGKTKKLSQKTRRKLVAVFLVVFVLSGILILATRSSVCSQTEKEEPIIKYVQGESRIEYNGRMYKAFGFNSHPYEFTTDKKLVKIDAFVSIYSLLNDEDKNFLYASNWQDSQLYTCIDDFEEKYPFGEYKAERITGIKVNNYYSADKELIELMLNIADYSNGTSASYPLKGSSSFTADIFIFEDNLPVSVCNIGKIAYYQDKWIFVDKNNKIQGELTDGKDTRNYTGIEINHPYAVKMLNEYSEKYFSYTKKEQ